MKKTTRKKIIIIGAGIAGLAAYARLIEYGFDAMILEARDRCGGRILTDDTLGIPLSGGAAWIHGIDNNPITMLAKRFHANMAPVNLNKFATFDRHGQIISQNIIQQFNEKFEQLLKQAKKLAYDSKHDISLATALSTFIENEKLSPTEQDLFKRKLMFFEGYIGANYEFLSARHWDQEEIWPGDNCFLTSSYQPIIDGLLQNCLVKLNTIVTNINTRENDIEIVSENTVFYADAVIITVPLGILKKNFIKFNPPLPIAKEKAIEHLDMGLFNITAIKFPTAFWQKEFQLMFFTQFDDSSIPTFLNLYHFIQQPILLGYSGGKTARQLENFSDEEIIEKTMQNFKKIYGTELPEPESYFTTRWSSDPFSYGSYSYVPAGASGDDYEAIAKPIANRLFFAGEATCSKHPATTHGAYLSGIREAERIKKIFFDKHF